MTFSRCILLDYPTNTNGLGEWSKQGEKKLKTGNSISPNKITLEWSQAKRNVYPRVFSKQRKTDRQSFLHVYIASISLMFSFSCDFSAACFYPSKADFHAVRFTRGNLLENTRQRSHNWDSIFTSFLETYRSFFVLKRWAAGRNLVITALVNTRV